VNERHRVTPPMYYYLALHTWLALRTLQIAFPELNGSSDTIDVAFVEATFCAALMSFHFQREAHSLTRLTVFTVRVTQLNSTQLDALNQKRTGGRSLGRYAHSWAFAFSPKEDLLLLLESRGCRRRRHHNPLPTRVLIPDDLL